MQMEQDSLESRLTDAYRRLVVGEKAVSVSLTQVEEAAAELDRISIVLNEEIDRLQVMSHDLISDSADAMALAGSIRELLSKSKKYTA